MAAVAAAASRRAPLGEAAGAASDSAVRAVATPGGHLYLVAHQDDDLLFMNPDIEDSIRAGLRVRTIFLTAAASGPTDPPPGPPPPTNPPAWYAREDGVFKAYRAMANVAQQPNDWTCQLQTYLTDKVVRVCTLTTQPLVSVVLMRLPDGGSTPSQPGMTALWAGSVPQLTSRTRLEVPSTPSSTYTRSQLVQVLAAMIADFAPDLIGTQDSTLAYANDHADHIAGAQFALEADHTYTRPHDTWMYRGYNVNIWWGSVPAAEVPNLSQAQHDEKLRIMEIYGGLLPANDPWQPFCWRRYAISRLSGGTGQLVGPGGQCIDVGNNPGDGTPAGLVPCSAAATRWIVNANGQIADAGTVIGEPPSAPIPGVKGERREMAATEKPNRPPHRLPAVSILKCLVVDANGSVRVSACASSPAQTWSVMSNGQIRGAGATCLSVAPDGVSVQALECQAERVGDKYEPLISQRWVQQMGDLETWSAQFSDADVGSPATYAGSFRLGDVNGDGYADACIRLGDGVHCALNTAAGAFGPHSLYSAAFADPTWQADAYGSTIQLGDVNGDGKADVCGRRSDGIVCATANADGTGFANARLWSGGTNFSDGDGWAVSPAYYGSVHLADVNGDGYADVCGRSPAGIVCALNNKAGGFGSASLWSTDFGDPGWQAPQYGSTIQFGDINGDGKADVCGRGPAGVQCTTANASGSGFIDTHPWSLRSDFSDADGWGAAASYYGSIRLADVDGDGRADLCGRSGNGVVCAVSNTGGFDAALALKAGGYTDVSGWAAAIYGATIQFGDLGRDGRRDVCGRGQAGLVCANAP
jgi:LmbE family N-acetylglucosaminyl deacetylase